MSKIFIVCFYLKKTEIYAGFLLLLSLSCNDDLEIKERGKQKNSPQKTDNEVTFKLNKITVRHRYKTPVAYVKEQSTATKPGKVELALLEYSGEAIVKVADELYKNYPFPSKHNNFKTDMR